MSGSIVLVTPNVGRTLNCALGCLVGITAGGANVNNLGSVIIGLVAGFLLVTSSNYCEKNGVDDAVGAVSVHGICGTWGVLAVAIFDTTDGLVFGGTSLFVPQLIGAISIGTWAYVTSFTAFKIIDALIGVRVSREEEIEGLDLSEHDSTAYGDFALKN